MPEIAAPDVGVGSWIERRARVAPDAPALITGARTLTYADYAGRIRRLADGLRALGVARGDRIGWIGPNHPAFLDVLFAAGRLGAVLAPVNHRLPAEVRAGVLADTGPVVLVEHAMPELTAAPSARHRVVVGAEHGGRGGAIEIEALIASSRDAAIDEPVSLDDLFLLPHTSGTTGRPKAVMLTHGNVTWNAINVVTTAGFRAADVTVAIAPFFRAGGTGVNVLPVLLAGGSVVVPADPSPDGLLRDIAGHRVTVGFGNPDLLDALARAETWGTADLGSLRFIITGGAPVPERLIRTFLDRGVTLLQGYGLSEAGPVALLLDTSRALTKVGAAGRPPTFVDARITDGDGREVRSGEVGELRVRGPNVMAGYWHRPGDTARALVDGGWLRTGDAARMDAEGDVWIVDRIDARFEVDGHAVFPGDVERVLLAHPAVADAGVAGVVPVGAPVGASRVGAAFVVLAPDGPGTTEADLLAWCRAHLAAHEVPASVTFVDELPRNAVGKLVREGLERLAARP